MEVVQDIDFATVTGGPYYPVEVTRGTDAWGLGYNGDADFSEHGTEVVYPHPANMDAATRPLRSAVALGAGPIVHSVEVSSTEQGQ